MRKLRHAKIRNTGLLFEFLIRQTTADILDKNNINYFIWGINYWINGSYTCYKIYPNRDKESK